MVLLAPPRIPYEAQYAFCSTDRSKSPRTAREYVRGLDFTCHFNRAASIGADICENSSCSGPNRCSVGQAVPGNMATRVVVAASCRWNLSDDPDKRCLPDLYRRWPDVLCGH